jgi:hypothetical protein
MAVDASNCCSLRQVGDRHGHTATSHTRLADAADRCLHQRLVGRQAAVHLPVADDEFSSFAHGLLQVSTILPIVLTAFHQGMRPRGAAGQAFARLQRREHTVDHRLDAPLLQPGPHLLAQGPRDGALERHRARPQGGAGDRQAPAQHQAGVELGRACRLAPR